MTTTIRLAQKIYQAVFRQYRNFFIILLLPSLISCASRNVRYDNRQVHSFSYLRLEQIGYTIQAGAFNNINNAVNLSAALQEQGLDAYYFIHDSGLYKVRFGDFRSAGEARRSAEALQQSGLIAEFYIVRPELSRIVGKRQVNSAALRKNIVLTAKKFLGIPYKWGGTSPREGFDCSGLAMVSYQLNGLKLPRTSREQFRYGKSVTKTSLQPGDLVFFATERKRRVSHVGIYLGNNAFIHAPKKGQKITTASLSSSYFRHHYLGARTYL